MKFQVLLSCMMAKDFSIVHKSNLDNVACLIINQCNTEKEHFAEDGIHRMCYTPTRGLSISRNMAIQYADADICLLSDDDEVFCTGLEDKVLTAYRELPDADIIIFKMLNRSTKLGNKARRLRKYEILRVSSWQISFKRSSVKDVVCFDRKLGAGTKNGAGEENKFLLDCYQSGMKIYYVPIEIASVAQEQSTWFSGYNKKFFFNRGKTTRYMLGFMTSAFYAIYFLVTKYNIYNEEISLLNAGKHLFKGILAKDIDTEYG